MSKKQNKSKSVLYLLYAFVLGAFVGAFIWAFLRLVSICTEFIWQYIPSQFNFPFYTVIVCVVGAVFVALFRLRFGDYPETLEVVLGKVKKDKRYPYGNIAAVALGAFLPLIFGGSIGPEAGLTGVVAGLCYWVGDRLRIAGKNLSELTSAGISSALSVLFGSPFFGIVVDAEPSADDEKEFVLPKPFFICLKIISALSGFLMFFMLGEWFGQGLAMPSLAYDEITNYDRLLGIPLILIGTLFGMLYALFRKISFLFFRYVAKTKLLSFISTLLGGLGLGIIGTILPLTMFSGEEQITELSETYLTYAPWMLIVIGTVKLFLTNFCLYSGWKGGNFFPMIFSGVSIGYGFSMLLGTTPAMTIAAVTAALLAVSMRKPLAVSALLLLCFPVRVIPWMVLASFLAANIPLPKFLRMPQEVPKIEADSAK